MGSSSESSFVAAPYLVEFPCSAARRENREDVVGANSRILPDLDTHGSIRGTLFRHPFPISQRNPAARPIAGTSLPVLLLVPAGRRESQDFGKQATSQTQKFGVPDPRWTRFRHSLRTTVECRSPNYVPRLGRMQTWTIPAK